MRTTRASSAQPIRRRSRRDRGGATAATGIEAGSLIVIIPRQGRSGHGLARAMRAQLGYPQLRLVRPALEGAAVAGAPHSLDDRLGVLARGAQAAQGVGQKAEGQLALAYDGHADALPLEL